MIWNVCAVVTSNVDAATGPEAQAKLQAALQRAGFGLAGVAPGLDPYEIEGDALASLPGEVA